jgi:tRNA(adenine34) deaminase
MLESSKDVFYINEALKLAQQAFDNDEVPVGAIVVLNDKIIGKGYNQVEQLLDSTAHAEMIAITAACNHIGAKYLMNATLYVTLEPCMMCAGAINWSKVGRLVYGASDPKNGYKKYCTEHQAFHHKMPITDGIQENDCATLMKLFFQNKR